jgi:hypothetical protein
VVLVDFGVEFGEGEEHGAEDTEGDDGRPSGGRVEAVLLHARQHPQYGPIGRARVRVREVSDWR